MQKEYIDAVRTSLTVNLIQGKPESFRKIVEKTSTVRVYDNGFIGVAGGIGNPNIGELEKQAIENLQYKLPYPCKLPENKVKDVDTRKKIFDTDKFVEYVTELMKRITKAAPDFIYSNKISYQEIEKNYSNTAGSKLGYKGNDFSAEIVIKAKDSANLFDSFYGFSENREDMDKIAADIVTLTEKHRTPVDIEPGKYPVIFDEGMVLGTVFSDLTAEAYAAGSSLFKNKLGQKVFADNYSVYVDRAPDKVHSTAFFDAEGEYADDYRQYIIQNGVLKNLLGNKRAAEKYNLPVVQSSAAQYDGIPQMSMDFETLWIDMSEKSFAELTKEKTVYVLVASGGDITTSGDYATPVQYAFLVQDGKILGKLPDIQVHGNIFDIYGKDFVTGFKNNFFRFAKGKYILTHMNVEK